MISRQVKKELEYIKRFGRYSVDIDPDDKTGIEMMGLTKINGRVELTLAGWRALFPRENLVEEDVAERNAKIGKKKAA